MRNKYVEIAQNIMDVDHKMYGLKKPLEGSGVKPVIEGAYACLV